MMCATHSTKENDRHCRAVSQAHRFSQEHAELVEFFIKELVKEQYEEISLFSKAKSLEYVLHLLPIYTRDAISGSWMQSLHANVHWLV